MPHLGVFYVVIIEIYDITNIKTYEARTTEEAYDLLIAP